MASLSTLPNEIKSRLLEICPDFQTLLSLATTDRSFWAAYTLSPRRQTRILQSVAKNTFPAETQELLSTLLPGERQFPRYVMFRTNGYFHPANNPWAATHFAELQSLVEMLYSRSGFTPQWQQGGDDLEAIQGLKNAKLKILQCAAHHAKIVWIAILLLAEHIDRMAPPSDEFTSASVRYRSEFVLWTNWIRPVGRGTLQAYWSIV